MTCFLHDLTSWADPQAVHLWAKLHIHYRVNKIFSDQNLKDTRYRNATDWYSHLRDRAIFANIDHVLSYLKNNSR